MRILAVVSSHWPWVATPVPRSRKQKSSLVLYKALLDCLHECILWNSPNHCFDTLASLENHHRGDRPHAMLGRRVRAFVGVHLHLKEQQR